MFMHVFKTKRIKNEMVKFKYFKLMLLVFFIVLPPFNMCKLR